MSTSAEVQGWLAHLRRGRRRWTDWRLWAVAGGVLGLGILGFLAYLFMVFRYAEIEGLNVAWSGNAPEEVSLHYRLLSPGAVRFRYAREGQRADLTPRVAYLASVQDQNLQWRIAGIRSGDVIRVKSRRGWRLVTVEAALPEPPRGMTGTGQRSNVYARRTQPRRLEWIGSLGGSSASEQAVSDGLEWLARHQAIEGFWSRQCLGTEPSSRCDRQQPCSGRGEVFEMAHTGLAILAFQGTGYYASNCTRHSQAVRRALDWIVAHQQPDGALVGSQESSGFSKYHKNHMYEHGIAAYALGDACASAAAINKLPPPSDIEALGKAVAFIEKQQHNDGGWRYTDNPREPGDTSVTGWQAFALRAAADAGIPASDRCLAKLDKFFRLRETGENGRTGYQNRAVQTDATTGMGMLARQFLFPGTHAPLLRDGAAYLADMAEKSGSGAQSKAPQRDFYLWYHGSLAMFHAGGKPWERWNRAVRDPILRSQCPSGCERGSWPPDDAWGEAGGRIYSTTMAILTLEAYYRYTLSDEAAVP